MHSPDNMKIRQRIRELQLEQSRRRLLEGPSRILVSRPNAKLGNSVLLTPLLQDIAASLPDAQVDVLTACDSGREVFAELPCVRSVHQLPRRGARHPLQHAGTLLQARRVSYDVIIDPCPQSWSSRFATRILAGRLKVGFQTSYKSKGTHLSIPLDGAPPHMGAYPVFLFRRLVLGMSADSARAAVPRLTIELSGAERDYGKRQIAHLLKGSPSRPVIAVAADATGAKRFSVEWWRQMKDCLADHLPSAQLVEIRPPSGAAAFPELPHFCSPSVRRVAAVINAADCLVCADSGLMHLGSATDTTTLGLFKVTDPAVYAPYGGRNAAIKAGDDAAALVAARIAAVLSEQRQRPLLQPVVAPRVLSTAEQMDTAEHIE